MVVGFILRDHGQESIGMEALKVCTATIEDLEAAQVDEFDLETIRKQFSKDGGNKRSMVAMNKKLATEKLLDEAEEKITRLQRRMKVDKGLQLAKSLYLQTLSCAKNRKASSMEKLKRKEPQ